MGRKITLIFAPFIAVVGLVALTYLASPPTSPPEWARVHAGMSRGQVLSIVGSPQISGWPENITETWQRKRFFSERRLFVLYEGEVVRSVCDGTWLRGYHWFQPRIETQ